MIILIFIIIKLLPFIYYNLNLDINGDLLKYNANIKGFFDVSIDQADFLKNEYI